MGGDEFWGWGGGGGGGEGVDVEVGGEEGVGGLELGEDIFVCMLLDERWCGMCRGRGVYCWIWRKGFFLLVEDIILNGWDWDCVGGYGIGGI